MMAALQDNTTHVVIQYCGQTENNKLLVDLVVRSWVFYSSTIEKWICKYPQPKDAIHVIKWVRECLPPKDDFFEYNVRIIKEAGSYKIGLKYLKNSYTTAEIKSIDGDLDYDSDDPENPEIYSEKNVQKILSLSKKICKEKSPVDDEPSNRKSEKKQSLRIVNKSIEYAKKKSSVNDGPSNQKPGKKQSVTVVNKSIEYAQEKSPVDDEPSNRKSGKKQGVTVVNKSIEYAQEKSPVDDEPSNRKSGKKQGVTVVNKSIEYAQEKSPVDNGPSDKKASAATKSIQRSPESLAPSNGELNRSTSDFSIEGESDTQVIDNEIIESSSDETAGLRLPAKAGISTPARRIGLTSPEMFPSRQVDESSHDSDDMIVNTPSGAIRKGTVAKPEKTADVRSPRRGEASTSKDNRISSPRPRTSSPRQSNREHPVVASLSDLKDFEERINKKIYKAKRSILYNISKIYRVVKSNIVAGNDASRDEEASLETVLDMRFPLENIADFESFEEKLKDADAKTVVKKYMSLFSCGTTPQEDIANILPELIKKNIQLLFSGSGKVQQGKSKRNFSVTETYSCMEEILIRKYRDKFHRKQIRSHTGVWLSRAGDREGGKIQREAKAAAERAKRAGNH